MPKQSNQNHGQQPGHIKKHLKLLLPYFKKNRFKILTGLLCMITVDLMQLVIPQIIKIAVDLLSKGELQAGQAAVQCLFIALLGLGMAALRYCWRILLMGSARDLEKGIRQSLFEHIVHLDLQYFNRVKTGDIMAHAISDINHVRMAFGFGLMVIVDTALLGGATVAIMVWTNPKLTVAALVPVPILIIMTRQLGKKMAVYHKSAQESFSLLTELVREKFYGIRIIKAYNFEAHASDAVGTHASDYFRKNLKRAFISALMKPMMGLFFNASSLIVLFYGGFLVMQQQLSPGELVAFLQYLGILSWPIIAIGWMTNLFQRGRASLNRIKHLLASSPAVREPAEPEKLNAINGGISLNNVSFSYDGKQDTLSDITLSIPPCKAFGITGPPGSGKSSLVQLIPRLYDPDRGNISIDRHDISRVRLDDLRSQIAFMPQESFLFSGTVRDNILMGKEIEDPQMEALLEACALDRTIEKLPQGLDTLVGERGITLSGGQKQRIALARTLAVRRPVIILDDPISQVDTRTATHILSHLENLKKNATMIIVSHRISALAGCDRICVMDHGKMIQTGNHEDLVRESLFYRTAYTAQQLDESEQ